MIEAGLKTSRPRDLDFDFDFDLIRPSIMYRLLCTCYVLDMDAMCMLCTCYLPASRIGPVMKGCCGVRIRGRVVYNGTSSVLGASL